MLAIIDLRVALVAVMCIAVSIGLAALTVRFWRDARLESPVLAPLEVMSERRFTKAPEDRQQLLLDEVRGLAAAPRVSPPKPAARALQANVDEYLEDDSFFDEPAEDVVVSDEVVAPMIDPLLGRRGK